MGVQGLAMGTSQAKASLGLVNWLSLFWQLAVGFLGGLNVLRVASIEIKLLSEQCPTTAGPCH